MPYRRSLNTSPTPFIVVFAGIALGIAINLAFGIYRLHEGTWLCAYLLCLK